MSEIKTELKNKLQNDSENYELNLQLGLIYAFEKHYRDSKLFFKKLIKINPKRYEAYLNLSNIEALKEKYDKSELILNEFISKNGYHIAIINGLATLYYNSTNFNKLEILIKKYLKYDDNYLLFFYQGVLYGFDEKITKQIIFLEKSIKINNKFWKGYEKLFDTFEKTNQLDKFYKLLDYSINIWGDDPKYIYFKSLYEQRKNNYDKALEILESNKTEEKFIKTSNTNYLINLYDLLSKIFLKLNNYNLSLEYAIKRNKISLNKPNNKRFDKNILLDVLRKYKYFYNNTTYTKKKSRDKYIFHDNLTFVLGFPRSGTTLLDSILRSHSKTLVLEEKPYLINIRHQFFKENTLEKIMNISDTEIFNLQKDYIESFNFNEKKLIIDKFPLNMTEIGFIKTIFPNSKIILVLRHPLDSILSCVLTSFKINEAMANYENLNTAAHFYNVVFDLFETYVKHFNLDFYYIKYENIVLNFKKEIQGLLQYLNLDFEDNVNQFYKTAQKRKVNTPSYHQVTQPLYKGSLNRYKKFDKIEVIKPLVKKWIDKFNYDLT